MRRFWFSRSLPRQFLALDEALERLAKRDPRQSRIVELRYFGGLSEEETAEVLGDLGAYRKARLESGAGVALPAGEPIDPPREPSSAVSPYGGRPEQREMATR